jgi:hypothetical protein
VLAKIGTVINPDRKNLALKPPSEGFARIEICAECRKESFRSRSRLRARPGIFARGVSSAVVQETYPIGFDDGGFALRKTAWLKRFPSRAMSEPA